METKQLLKNSVLALFLTGGVVACGDNKEEEKNDNNDDNDTDTPKLPTGYKLKFGAMTENTDITLIAKYDKATEFGKLKKGDEVEVEIALKKDAGTDLKTNTKVKVKGKVEGLNEKSGDDKGKTEGIDIKITLAQLKAIDKMDANAAEAALKGSDGTKFGEQFKLEA